MKLLKMSAPGWEKEFATEDELRAELFQHICGLCRTGEEFKDYGIIDPVITEQSPIGDMLSTSCGCEFWVEEE